MMFAARMMCALRHIRQTSHHCDQREQHHFERSEKHHIAAGDASLRYTRLRLDYFARVWYNETKKGGGTMIVKISQTASNIKQTFDIESDEFYFYGELGRMNTCQAITLSNKKKTYFRKSF